MKNKNITIQNNWVGHNLDISSAIIHDMAQSVGHSFGPVGASTLMVQEVGEKSYTASVTKDGYTLISKLNYFHPVAIAMKRLLLESMLSVLSTAGDGTTSTTLLIDFMLQNYIERKELFDRYPAQVITNTGKAVVEKFSHFMRLAGQEAGATSLNDLFGIIDTSVNGDTELSNVVKKVVAIVTEDGKRLDDVSISYTPSPNKKTSYKIEEGYVIPRASEFESHTCSREEKAKIILINQSLATPDEFKGLLQFIGKLVSNSLNNSGGVEANIERTLLVTYNIHNKEVLEQEIKKLKHAYQARYGTVVFPVSLVIYGEDGTVQSHEEHTDFEYMLAQGTAYDVTMGARLKDFFVDGIPDGTPFDEEALLQDYIIYMYNTNQVTSAKVRYDRTSTIISDIKSFIPDTKETLIERLEKEIEEAKEDDKIYIRKRLSKINGKFAIIEIGGDNEWDIKRKQDAIDDVVGAIRLASKSAVCGGLSTLIRKIHHLYDITFETTLEKELATIIMSAYNRLTKLLLSNCKMSDELIEDTLKAIDRNICNVTYVKKLNHIPTPYINKEYIRLSFDLRKYIDILTSGEENIKIESFASTSVLNTVDAEIKILEASVNALLTLVSINQIALPDQYDCSAYKNGHI